jgi:hypothetical protein
MNANSRMTSNWISRDNDEDDGWREQALRELPTTSIMISHIKHDDEDLSPPDLPQKEQTTQKVKITTAFVSAVQNSFGTHLDPTNIPKAPEYDLPVFKSQDFELASASGIPDYITDQGQKSNGLLLM